MAAKHYTIHVANGYEGPSVGGLLSFLLGHTTRYTDSNDAPFDAYRFVIPADVAEQLGRDLIAAATEATQTVTT